MNDNETATTTSRTSVEQLHALADRFEAEAEELGQERTTLGERMALKQRLAQDLRREAEATAGRLFQVPAPTRPDIAVGRNGSGKPGTSEAIIAVLEAKSAPASGTEVFEELERRGWLPLDAKSPRNAVRASLWTLGKNGKILSLGDTPASRRWAAKTSDPNAQSAGGTEDVG